MSEPLDVKRGWLNVARRLQKAGRRHHTRHSVLKLIVLVDPDGNPVSWLMDEPIEVEPERGGAEALLRLLTF